MIARMLPSWLQTIDSSRSSEEELDGLPGNHENTGYGRFGNWMRSEMNRSNFSADSESTNVSMLRSRLSGKTGALVQPAMAKIR